MSASDTGGSSRVPRRLVRNVHALSRSGSFGCVVMAPAAARPVTLRGTAVDVWDFFAAPHTESELVDWLVDRYDADRSVIAQDVEPAVAELLAEGLLGSAS